MRDDRGQIVTHEVKCRECKGRGSRPVPCPPYGTGKTVVKPCPTCEGTGRRIVPVRRARTPRGK